MARHRVRLALIIVVDEPDRAAEQPALGVDLLLPDLHAEQRLLAVGGQRAGLRHGEADLDRLSGRSLGLCRRRQREQAAPAASAKILACTFRSIVILPVAFLLGALCPSATGALGGRQRGECCHSRSPRRRVAGIQYDGLYLAGAAAAESRGLVVFRRGEAGHALLEGRKFDHHEAVEFLRSLP